MVVTRSGRRGIHTENKGEFVRGLERPFWARAGKRGGMGKTDDPSRDGSILLLR
jgi:hypothetical protein